jgi:hypothetical protein
MFGGEPPEEIPYLESLARQKVSEIANEAVADWFKQHRKNLKQQIVESIDANAIADSYLREVEKAIASRYSLTVTVTPKRGDDDD